MLWLLGVYGTEWVFHGVSYLNNESVFWTNLPSERIILIHFHVLTRSVKFRLCKTCDCFFLLKIICISVWAVKEQVIGWTYRTNTPLPLSLNKFRRVWHPIISDKYSQNKSHVMSPREADLKAHLSTWIDFCHPIISCYYYLQQWAVSDAGKLIKVLKGRIYQDGICYHPAWCSVQ